MKKKKLLNKKREARQKRTRARIFGTAEFPRLSVFRSNKAISVQLIDDESSRTLAAASTAGLKGNKTEQAAKVGEAISEKAKALGIKRAVFDRRSYRYHGRVKAVAEGARKAGLNI
jgi:large subunit ribosomal protein L18